MPSWTNEQLAAKLAEGKVDLPPDGGQKSAKPQRPAPDEPMAEDEGEEVDTARFHVRVTSFRKRLIDADNLAGGAKYFVDSLRYAGCISEDSPDQITIEHRQKKAKEEKTLIEIFDRWKK